MKYFCLLTLLFSTLYAKQVEAELPCGCPVDHNVCEEERVSRSLPAPLAGVITSMKSYPGLWTIVAVGGAVTGLALIVCDSPSGSVHLHSHS